MTPRRAGEALALLEETEGHQRADDEGRHGNQDKRKLGTHSRVIGSSRALLYP
jgi:hypothetical protein